MFLTLLLYFWTYILTLLNFVKYCRFRVVTKLYEERSWYTGLGSKISPYSQLDIVFCSFAVAFWKWIPCFFHASLSSCFNFNSSLTLDTKWVLKNHNSPQFCHAAHFSQFLQILQACKSEFILYFLPTI